MLSVAVNRFLEGSLWNSLWHSCQLAIVLHASRNAKHSTVLASVEPVVCGTIGNRRRLGYQSINQLINQSVIQLYCAKILKAIRAYSALISNQLKAVLIEQVRVQISFEAGETWNRNSYDVLTVTHNVDPGG